MMEKRLEMVERGECKAEPLSDVICLEDDEGDTMRVVFTSGGAVGGSAGGENDPTEQLRSR